MPFSQLLCRITFFKVGVERTQVVICGKINIYSNWTTIPKMYTCTYNIFCRCLLKSKKKIIKIRLILRACNQHYMLRNIQLFVFPMQRKHELLLMTRV